MAGVDNRIVTMKFDNREFESNARTSMSTLQKLKESMNFGSIVSGTVKGLGTVDSALQKIGLRTPFTPFIKAANSGLSMVGGVLDKLGVKNPFATATTGAGELQRGAQGAAGGMGVLDGAVTGVSAKFVALSTIAITALSNITNKAISSGAAMAKSLTISPIMQGFNEYETNLNSIQTILANTGLEGQKGLNKVNQALGELNTYADKTIYNFSEMARNIGTFTAAGVDLKTATSSIKGIANLAAVSGSNAQQASTAMYQLSQAIASGKVGLMDWNSVVNAGMGGKVFQDALIKTAQHMGTIKDSAISIEGPMKKMKINGQSFRDSIMAKPGEQSWLTSDVLTTTLKQLSGDLSDADLAAQGYSKSQIAAIQKQAKMAVDAATKVKTVTQLMDTLKEAVGSGWTQTFQQLFGDFGQAKRLFTGLSNYFGGLIQASSNARNQMLKQWQKGGGRIALIDGIQNAWKAVLGILKPIGQAFRDIFPKKTADDLIKMSKTFQNFTKSLIPSKETMANIRDIAGGFFAVLDIGKTILLGVVDGLKALFSSVGAGQGGFLNFAAGIGRSVKSFDEFLKRTGIVSAFFKGLGGLLSVPLSILKGLGNVISAIFQGFKGSAAGAVSDKLGAITDKLHTLKGAASGIEGFFAGLSNIFKNLGERIGKALVGIGNVIASALTSKAFEPALKAINTGLLAAITTMLIHFFKGGNIDITGGLFKSMTGMLNQVTGTLSALQTKLKADALMKIGGAIAVLAGALLVLSLIDPGDMAKALTAMSTGMGVLIGSLTGLMKLLGPVGLAQIYIVTGALLKMSAAVLLMAFALRTLSGIDFGSMMRGLVTLGASLFIISKAMIAMAAGSKGMAKASTSLILMGVALNLLAVALKIMASLSWEEMARGLTTLLGTLVALAVGLRVMPPLNAQAISLLALAASMNVLAIALKIFASMSLAEMAKGMVGLAGSLVIIAGALRLMPKGMLLKAVAMNALAASMVVLSGALKIMGGMGWTSIAKGMIVLAGALTIFAIGLQAIGIMGTIGSVGLLAAAAALAVLVPVLVALGAMSWESILKGLIGLAGIFTVLGVAGAALAPLVPVIIGLSAAVLLLGAGMALMGVGLLGAATALGVVVAAGAAGVRLFAAALGTLIAGIPPALAAFGKGIVDMAVVIGQGAPKIATAFGRILGNMINQVINNTPRLGRMFMVMLNTALRVITSSVPAIARAGMTLIVGFLRAVSSRIGQIVTLATDIIVKFLETLGKNLPRIINAGVVLIIRFLNGVAKAIRDHSGEIGKAGANIAVAIIQGTVNGLVKGAGLIKDAALQAAKNAWQAVKDFFHIGSPSKLMRDTVGVRISEGLALGVKDGAPLVTDEMTAMGKGAMGKLSETLKDLDNAFSLDPNLTPTVTPVLDLTALTKEANKMTGILDVAPIMPTVSYATAADISAATRASAESSDGSTGTGGAPNGGDTYVTYEHHLHSPAPLDSVKIYRDGKSLIAMKKEELAKS